MLIRISQPGRAAFQLRPGEAGLSMFDQDAVEPPLSEEEVLAAFRPGSVAIFVPFEETEAAGLIVESVPGADVIPERLRESHREVRPGPGTTRAQFKRALQGLEGHGD